MADIHAVVRARRDAILRRWASDPAFIVSVEHPAALKTMRYRLSGRDDTSSAQVGNRSMGSVVFSIGAGNRDVDTAVWVASGYSGYRSAYQALLSEIYGAGGASSSMEEYDVDHLLNRARSVADTTFLRVEAVPAEINRAWGRVFERIASNPKFYANQKRERRTMSYLIAAKLGGQWPPAGPSDRGGIARLSRFFQTYGLDPKESAQGLTSMLTFAFR